MCGATGHLRPGTRISRVTKKGGRGEERRAEGRREEGRGGEGRRNGAENEDLVPGERT